MRFASGWKVDRVVVVIVVGTRSRRPLICESVSSWARESSADSLLSVFGIAIGVAAASGRYCCCK